jgi:hypothetical protein
MRATKVVGLVIDLLLLAISLPTGGKLGDALRVLALVIAGVAVALALFLLILLTVVLVDQRRPPYEMGSGGFHG